MIRASRGAGLSTWNQTLALTDYRPTYRASSSPLNRLTGATSNRCHGHSSTRSHTSCIASGWFVLIHSLGSGGTPAIWFAPGRAFARTDDLDVLPAWCARVLAANDDVAKKLAKAPFTERHAFLVATPDGDLTAYWMLTTRPHPGWPDRPPDALPTATPELPLGVDCVWACGPERVVAWFPDRGWINAS